MNTINGAKNCMLFLQENITIVFSKSLTCKFVELVHTCTALKLREFLQYLLGEEAVGRSVLYACSW
jgi:hypothetical protein